MKKIIGTILEGYSPLKIRNFRIYMAGQAISFLGTWMQATAQSWVVWELSHSPLKLGIVAMLGLVPFLIFGPWAGVWADILDRRKLLIATQISAMFLAIIFAVLVQTNLIQIWHIYALATLLGIVSSLDMPAQQAFIGDLSGVEHIQKAIAINSAIVQISRMLGPALAGWLIAAAGIAPAFWLNGLSFLAVIASLFVVRTTQLLKPQSGKTINEFFEGLRFIRIHPRIMDLIILTVIVTFFAFSSIQIMPAIATDVLHGKADVLGLLLGASGAGALIGSMFVVHIANKIRQTGLVNAAAAIWSGAWFVLFSLSRNTYISMICLFLSSVLIPVIFTTTNALIQISTPQNMRARVLSALIMVTFGVQPIASILTGYSAELFSAPTAIFINGSLIILGSVILLFFSSNLRQWTLDRHQKS